MVPGFRRPVSQNVVPKVGPQILKKKCPRRLKKAFQTCAQVLATWQWSNYLHDEIIKQHKTPLLINIDESPMPLVYGTSVGNLLRRRRHSHPIPEVRRFATRQEQRMHFTYVAMICNIAWIQPLLPQILIIPERILPLKEWRDITEDLPNNVYLIRQKSMWVTATLYATILRLLRKCMKRYNIQSQHRIIILADSFGGHTTVRALKAVRDYGYYFLLLSAGLTWLIQPLDVYAFVRLKRFMRERFMRVVDDAGERLIFKTLKDLVSAIQVIFTNANWAHAFESLGLCGNCLPTSKTILAELEWRVFPPARRTRPTEEEICISTPRGRRLNRDGIFGTFPKP